MFKYFKLILGFIPIKKTKIYRERYRAGIKAQLYLLLQLKIGSVVTFDILNVNMSYMTTTDIAKFGEYKLTKVNVYKSWDLYKILLPVETAWLLTDEKNILHAISFDKEMMLNLISSRFCNKYEIMQ